MIIQMTITRNELFLIKEMMPQWQKYADGFVFMDDLSDDGTYEWLLENKEKYNILEVLRTNKSEDHLWIESDHRQRLFDAALKYSKKIICLDTDEYLDGLINKQQLNQILDTHKNVLFHLPWIQYTGSNEIRVDGPWNYSVMDRLGSYVGPTNYKYAQVHADHLPNPGNVLTVKLPHLFIAHLQWLHKPTVAIKQYFYKIMDYVNKLKFNANVVDSSEYDKSVNEFNWSVIKFDFPLKISYNVYEAHNPYKSAKFKFIKENIKKYNIPNLNDWGMNIH